MKMVVIIALAVGVGGGAATAVSFGQLRASRCALTCFKIGF